MEYGTLDIIREQFAAIVGAAAAGIQASAYQRPFFSGCRITCQSVPGLEARGPLSILVPWTMPAGAEREAFARGAAAEAARAFFNILQRSSS